MEIIDCHSHILSAGTRDYNRRFLQDLCGPHFKVTGLLPSIGTPTEEDWAKIAWLFEPIDPKVSIADHEKAGVSRILILAQAPSEYTEYGLRGTIDLNGVTGVEGEKSIEKTNDYLAALVRKYPDKFIGFGAVNPRHRGVKAAIKELERLVGDLKLTGLKLYPMYDYYSPDDPDLAFPIFAKAQEMGIPVTVHMGTSPARYTKYEFGMPYLLDIVGQKFPDLKLLVAHGGIPWLDECISMVVRHPNFYIDLSYTSVVLTREELFRYLLRCKRWGLPLSRVCWGTDYPLHETLDTLVPKFLSLNEEASRLNAPKFSDEEMELMLGGNFLRVCNLI
jgi:predicted TIM-barrel fold metal-dependent hydrolase